MSEELEFLPGFKVEEPDDDPELIAEIHACEEEIRRLQQQVKKLEEQVQKPCDISKCRHNVEAESRLNAIVLDDLRRTE